MSDSMGCSKTTIEKFKFYLLPRRIYAVVFDFKTVLAYIQSIQTIKVQGYIEKTGVKHAKRGDGLGIEQSRNATVTALWKPYDCIGGG